MTEILYKVGDSAGYGDGDVIAVNPDGYTLTWPEIQSWMSTGNAPAEIVSVWPGYLIRRFNLRFRRLQYIMTHTPAESVQTLGIKVDQAIEENRIGQIDLAKMEEYGVDTSWGWEDLKVHGVMKCEPLDEHEKDALLSPDRTDDIHGKFLKKRCHSIDYEKLLPKEKTDRLKDKAKHIPVDRDTTYTIDQAIISKYGKLKKNA